jgi:hypothetical protein
MMHAGEGTLKSDLWKLNKDGFTLSPHFMHHEGHIHRDINRALKFRMGGSPAHI